MLDQSVSRGRAVGRERHPIAALQVKQERPQLEGRAQELEERSEVHRPRDFPHPRKLGRVLARAQLEDRHRGQEDARVLLVGAERRFADFGEDRVVVGNIGFDRLEQHAVGVEDNQVKHRQFRRPP